MSKEKKQKLKEYQKIIVKLIKTESLNLIKKCMTISIKTFHFAEPFSLLISYINIALSKIFFISASINAVKSV